MSMTLVDDAKAWRGLCEFLDAQRFNHSQQSKIPPEYWWLLSRNYAERRRAIGAIYYWSHVGWCLHKDWREKLKAAGI